MESAAAAEASWNGCASARGRRGQKCRVFRYLFFEDFPPPFHLLNFSIKR